MKKAKPSKKTKSTLALDDPRWWPLTDAHAELTRRTGSRSLAADDLTEALRGADGRPLRYMRRRVGPGTGPDRELGSRAFWVTYRLDSWSDALLVVPRARAGPLVTSLRGWIFYVWKPDFEKRWPTPSEQRAPSTKRRPGPRANWRLPAAAEMHRIRKEEGRTPTAPELCQFCDKTVNHYPDESEMRALIRFLLGE